MTRMIQGKNIDITELSEPVCLCQPLVIYYVNEALNQAWILKMLRIFGFDIDRK